MKLLTLMDDQASEHFGLYHEHGLSFYIETASSKILFDFGAGSHTLDNARTLNLPLASIDYAIGSHGHYDHAGGYPAFAKAGLRAPLVTGRGYFREKYAVSGIRMTYLGNSFDRSFLESKQIEHMECDGLLRLNDQCCVMNRFHRIYDFETIPKRFVLRSSPSSASFSCSSAGMDWEEDAFHDEICLVLRVKNGLAVIVGCSHPGILNILSSVQKKFDLPIVAVAGGTHLMEASDDRIRKTLQIMQSMGIQSIGFNHCSGNRMSEIMRTEFPDLHAAHLAVGDGLLISESCRQTLPAFDCHESEQEG